MKSAILAIQSAAAAGVLRSMNVKQVIKDVLDRPADHVTDEHFGPLAKDVLQSGELAPIREPISYRTWGDSGIEPESHAQMRQACALPMATAAALMPDAHVGYGLPIGGVLALDNAVVPYAVGVDIACRMKLVGSRHAGLDAHRSAEVRPLRASHRARHPFRRRLGSPNSPRPSGHGPRLVGHAHHPRKQRQGLEAARHFGLGQPFRRVRPC